MAEPRHNFAALAHESLSTRITQLIQPFAEVLESSSDPEYTKRWADRVAYTQLSGVILGLALAEDPETFSAKILAAIQADKDYHNMQLAQHVQKINAPKVTKSASKAATTAALLADLKLELPA